jgi:hypothetical protein
MCHSLVLVSVLNIAKQGWFLPCLAFVRIVFAAFLWGLYFPSHHRKERAVFGRTLKKKITKIAFIR